MSYLIRAICIRLRKINNYFHNRKFRHIFKQCGTNLLVYGIPRITATDKIIIGNNVNLNNGCVLNALASKITICDNVIVSAGSVVISDITENNVLVAGNPAKIVKRY